MNYTTINYLALILSSALVSRGIISIDDKDTIAPLIEIAIGAIVGVITAIAKTRHDDKQLLNKIDADVPRKTFNAKSMDKLKLVHPDLTKLMLYALNTNPPYDFFVVWGVRTLDEQKTMVSRGASKTLDSDHLYGIAVDIGIYTKDGKYDQNVKPYLTMRKHIDKCAKHLNIALDKMIDWDSGHYALTKDKRGWNKK